MPDVDRLPPRCPPMPRPMWRLTMAIAIAIAMVCLCGACRRPTAPATPSPRPDPSAQRIRDDVRLLADDAMQGRATGTPGFERAADVVAARFRALGLAPAGDGGTYSQRVPLLKATRLADGARLDVERADRSGVNRTIALRFRDHFLTEPNFNAADAAVRAPAVFVGQGIFAPDLGQDDFVGLDLHGRIAVVLGGAPPRFDPDRRAFLATTAEKLRTLAARGAVGAVLVDTAEDEARAPWAQQAGNWERPGMRLRDAAGHGIDAFPQLRVVARVSAAAADLLFDGSGHTAAELAHAAQLGRLHGFPLPATLALSAHTHIEPFDSRNVVGRLSGSDPVLGAEAIVYSAHLDHLGVVAPVDGDAIDNGALDNALGVAITLETARQLRDAKATRKRTLLFVALTAEEQGLLGAQWFVLHPPARLVADVNLDMPMLLAPARDVVPIGAAHSSLQDTLALAAKAVGVGLSADPFPDEAVFVRSDQFAFVRAGVPALYLDGGVVPAASSAGRPADLHTLPKLAQRDFLRRCYHQPCDDVRLPIQYGDAARMARLEAQLALLLGNAPAPPRWHPGDFFGTRVADP